MTTRRIRKKWRKEDWLAIVEGMIEAVERFTGKKVLNSRAVGKVASNFLHGKDNHFIIMPLSMEGVQNSNLHFFFERWPLKATLQMDEGSLNSKALAAEFKNCRCSHPEIEVCFREAGYEMMKSELVSKSTRIPPIAPNS
ncbi:MAG TPA: hypothetical protein VNK70_02305 [Candidatus Paceibacterota bacterium]|nr:hypothetical protein [Candidatus Paceibacterota bacterium]